MSEHEDIAASGLLPFALPASPCAKRKSLSKEELIASIRSGVAAHPHLLRLRDFNHANLKVVSEQHGADLSGARILDVGASVHGYALEAAINLGYQQYIGIDLGITRSWGDPYVEVSHGPNRHVLCQMDAHRLWLEDESVDVVVCLSGFEHYLYPEMALEEIVRVLRRGGIALISYEPIWTCSYGHHLHHFGIGFEQVPPWSHLLLNKNQMRELLATKPWPENLPIDRAQAIDWIYDGRDINRRDCRFHHSLLNTITCTKMLWHLPQPDSSEQAAAAVDYAASMLPYTREELLTRGFSCCFRK